MENKIIEKIGWRRRSNKKVIIDTEIASFMTDLTSSYYLYREEAKLIDNEYFENVLVDIEQLNLPNFDKIKAEIEEFIQKLDELRNQEINLMAIGLHLIKRVTKIMLYIY